jgi:hypothetical protein
MKGNYTLLKENCTRFRHWYKGKLDPEINMIGTHVNILVI